MCELGWPGIAIAEEHGGQGLGVVELVILQEELGYACAPSPLISNAYAGAVIEAAGSDEQKQKWLPGIASGEERGAAELDLRRRSRSSAPPAARSVLVLADGDGAKLVETGDAEARAARPDRHHPRLLPGRAPTAASRCRATSTGAATIGQVALAAELVGVAQRALDMAVEYAKEREQFGRPIGAYQAVSHRLRRDALGGRGGALAHLLRRLVRRRRARVAAARGLDGQGARLRRRHARSPTTRSRPSAASASPGSTTSTSCSSAPGSAPADGHAASTASASRRSSAWTDPI